LKINIILLFGLAAMISAQELNVTATNTMKFGIGKEWVGDKKDIEVSKQYFEDWIDVHAVKGDFSAGIRFEAADSSSHNEAIRDITKISFGYSRDKINITAGDFYGSFGRGLVLGLKESRADFFDSKVTGGKFEYCGEKFGFKALGGKSYFKYINDYFPEAQTVEQMDNAVLGSELVLPVSDYLGSENIVFSIGGSYLYVKGDDVPETQFLYEEMFIEKSQIGGLSLDVSGYDVEFYNEYAIKTTERTPSQTGWANYTSLAYAVKGLSVGLEYKDYYKYGANPNDPASGFTPFQNAPELTIAHSSHLLNNHPHEVNPNDEIGYKLAAMYQLNDNIGFNGTLAAASKHSGDNIMPESADGYLPYLDSWIGGGYDAENYGISAGFGYMKDSPVSKGVNQLIIPGEETDLEVYSDERITFMGEYNMNLNEEMRIALCGEYQAVSNEFLDEDLNDLYGSVEYGYSPYGYINVSLVTTAEKSQNDPWYSFVTDISETWLGIEAGINIRENHKLELFYGRERAGIKCSGGTCRQVPEFDGFRMTLVSDF
jgi:hypothetical protein